MHCNVTKSQFWQTFDSTAITFVAGVQDLNTFKRCGLRFSKCFPLDGFSLLLLQRISSSYVLGVHEVLAHPFQKTVLLGTWSIMNKPHTVLCYKVTICDGKTIMWITRKPCSTLLINFIAISVAPSVAAISAFQGCNILKPSLLSLAACFTWKHIISTSFFDQCFALLPPVYSDLTPGFLLELAMICPLFNPCSKSGNTSLFLKKKIPIYPLMITSEASVRKLFMPHLPDLTTVPRSKSPFDFKGSSELEQP